MKALQFIDKELHLNDVEMNHPREGDALVRILLAGVCATDLEIVKGYMGFEGTLGHEFVGIVEECRSDASLVGQRVVGEINVSCGECKFCRKDLGRHCPYRTVLGILGLDGAFAEYLALPVTNLHVVPDQVSNRDAVFAEPLAAAFEILEQVEIKPDRPALVIGDGRLAQLIVRVLDLNGITFDITGLSLMKIDRMKGIPRKVFLNDQPLMGSYKYVIDASGSPSGWETAVQSVQPRGKIILKSTYASGFDFNPAPLVINEISVVGSRCGPFENALAALSQGLVLSDLIDAEFPLIQWREAVDRAGDPDTLKVIFRMSDS